jgi:hypothetical protein
MPGKPEAILSDLPVKALVIRSFWQGLSGDVGI